MSGLYLEGADWDIERGCLTKSKPKVLVVDLPVLKIIPIEAHRLKLQVGAASSPPLGCSYPSFPFPGRGSCEAWCQRGVTAREDARTPVCTDCRWHVPGQELGPRQPQETPGHS